jgi:HEAT repeat protein
VIENKNIQEIFARALVSDIEDESAWKAVRELRTIGTQEVFDFASKQTRSPSWIARLRAVDVIAQLGNCTGISHPYRTDAGPLIERMLLNEADVNVLHSCIIAHGHLRYFEGADSIARFSTHPSEDIRHAVAVAFGSMADDSEQAASTLLKLMSDQDEDVRDWATFGLGVQSERDTNEIREAFVERLSDAHFDTQCEAMAGLAKRKDLRALPLLLECLDDGLDSSLTTEAATELLGLDREPQDWTAEQFAEALREKYSTR